MIFFVLLVIVINQVIGGLFCRFLALEKNRDGTTWFWLGFLFGPAPIALLTLIGLPELEPHGTRTVVRTPQPSGGKGHSSPADLSLNLTMLSEVEARVFSQHSGRLLLDSLTDLPAGVAKTLAAHKGVLSLNSLTTISEQAAEALGGHLGELFLDGVRTLSDAAAESLAKHRGALSLAGITTLSQTAAQALRRNREVLLPKNIQPAGGPAETG